MEWKKKRTISISFFEQSTYEYFIYLKSEEEPILKTKYLFRKWILMFTGQRASKGILLQRG